MNIEKNCINCKNITKNSLDQYTCSLTELITEPKAVCDSYEYREVIQNEKKIPKYLVPLIIVIAAILFPTLRNLNKTVERKKFNENHLRVIEKRKKEIHFNEYRQDDESIKYKKYTGIFYTQDSLCPIERFDRRISDFFNRLPESLQKEDTIILSNELFFIRPDSSFKKIHIIDGYNIKIFKVWRFDNFKNNK